jgi:LDH2 family malate/lactate/ureidoglycolate dehydrogenase
MSCTPAARRGDVEHKGYALAFICEMLAAVTGSGVMRPERQDAGNSPTAC